MALHRVQRNAQHPGDLGQVELFLEAERDHDPLPRRELGEHLTNAPPRQRIALLPRAPELPGVREGDQAKSPPAGGIDTAVRRDLPKPVNQVRRRLDRADVPVKLQKNVLGQILRLRAIAQRVKRDAEDHRLMFADQVRERHLVAGAGSGEGEGHLLNDCFAHSMSIYGGSRVSGAAVTVLAAFLLEEETEDRMKSLSIPIPAIALAVLIMAVGCGVSEGPATETVGETATTETTSTTSTTTVPADATLTATAPPPSEQIAEGAQEVGQGLEKAGRGVAQATGKALQKAGQDLQQAARPDAEEKAPAPEPAAPVQPAPPPQVAAPAPTAAVGNATNGGRVFAAKKCAACHGVNGAGGTPIAQKQNIPPLGSSAVKGQSDADLTRILAQGKSAVSASAHKSKNLTPDEMRDLIAWIRSL